MKNPLCDQMTEYDCGSTSVLNAVSCLFRREEIPPEIVRISCCTSWIISVRTAPEESAEPPAWP